MQDYDVLLRTLDFNGDCLRDIDGITAAHYREAASAIRHLRADRDLTLASPLPSLSQGEE